MPRSGSADGIDRLVSWFKSHFGVPIAAPVTLSVFRGGGDAAGGLWIIPAAGGAPRALGPGGKLRAPVFLSDGTIVAVDDNAPAARVVHLAASDGHALGEACPAGPEPIDLVFAAADSARVGAISRAGHVLEIQLAGCARRTLKTLPRASKPANQIRLALMSLSRECHGQSVATSAREEDLARGTRREEVVLRAADGTTTRMTTDAPMRLHLTPAFSPDCREIVYVGADPGL